MLLDSVLFVGLAVLAVLLVKLAVKVEDLESANLNMKNYIEKVQEGKITRLALDITSLNGKLSKIESALDLGEVYGNKL
jgi:hypothetical protein